MSFLDRYMSLWDYDVLIAKGKVTLIVSGQIILQIAHNIVALVQRGNAGPVVDNELERLRADRLKNYSS